MFTVKISVLKNKLSEVLRRVRKGEEAIVLDRDQPVARLTGISSTSHKDTPLLMEQLAKRGIIRPATKKPPSAEWLRAHRVHVKGGVDVVQVLLQEREESW